MMEEIDEEYIELVCDELRCYLMNLHHNKGQDDYEKASQVIGHIGCMIDRMIDEDE
jgi:hypothetical protein